MFWTTGLILVLAISQVPAKLLKADFVENVISEASKGSSRIVSGWPAYPGQLPHQTSLRMVNSAGGVGGCGGSVVSREWVITAAHCTAGQITIVVRAGVTELITPQYIHESQEWYNHPSYNDNFPGVVQPNDIAMLKLQRPVTYNRLLQPIRLQSKAEALRNYDNEVVLASGFGMTWTAGSSSEVLNWVYLRAVSNPACAALYGTALINANAICARFYNVTSQSTCQGDSGGPLVHVDNDGVPVLIGIASFVAGGNHGCHSGLPAGFIRPGPFLPWLEQVTGIDFENVEEEEATTPQPEVPTTTELIPQTTQSPETTPTTTPPTTTYPTTTPTTAPPTTTTTTTTAAPTTTTTAPPTTTTPKPSPTPEPEEPEEESEEDSSSEEDDDPEMSELLKKLIVKVKVKVNINNTLKKKVKVKCVDEA